MVYLLPGNVVEFADLRDDLVQTGRTDHVECQIPKLLDLFQARRYGAYVVSLGRLLEISNPLLPIGASTNWPGSRSQSV